VWPAGDHALRRLAIHGKTLQQSGFGGDGGGAVHPERLANAGNEKEQGDSRVGDDVAQAVNAIIAASLGNEQRLVVLHRDEARRVAARRCIQALGPGGCQHGEGRSFDQRPVLRVHEAHFLTDRAFADLAVQRFELGDRTDGVGVAVIGHGAAHSLFYFCLIT
jgi:hypothetical protein